MLSIDITDRQIKLVRGVHSGNKIRVQDADMRELTSVWSPTVTSPMSRW